MSAASHQPANATNTTGISSPYPSATHQGAGDGKASRIRDMNGSRLFMVWSGNGWVNHVIGFVPYSR